MEITDLIALRLTELMDKNNISVFKLETLTGIANSGLYAFLNRKHKSIKIKTLQVICEALNITITEFFNDKRFSNVEALDFTEWNELHKHK